MSWLICFEMPMNLSILVLMRVSLQLIKAVMALKTYNFIYHWHWHSDTSHWHFDVWLEEGWSLKGNVSHFQKFECFMEYFKIAFLPSLGFIFIYNSNYLLLVLYYQVCVTTQIKPMVDTIDHSVLFYVRGVTSFLFRVGEHRNFLHLLPLKRPKRYTQNILQSLLGGEIQVHRCHCNVLPIAP